MIVIVQRAKHITVGTRHLGEGVVVFLPQGTQGDLDSVVDRVLRIKFWDGWKRSAGLEHTVLCICEGSAKAAGAHVAHLQDGISFINDGPCTFLLEM